MRGKLISRKVNGRAADGSSKRSLAETTKGGSHMRNTSTLFILVKNARLVSYNIVVFNDLETLITTWFFFPLIFYSASEIQFLHDDYQLYPRIL